MNADKLPALLRYLGGDISRALPDWQPPETTPLEVLGSVSAGVVSIAQEERRTIPGAAVHWRRSVYWHLVDASHPVCYLEVRGDSMEPEFPAGCLLACGRSATQDPPPLTPVVASIHGGEEATFKLYRRTRFNRRQEVELHPINRVYEVQRFDAAHFPRIDFVVLGFLNPWTRGAVVRGGPKNIVLREG